MIFSNVERLNLVSAPSRVTGPDAWNVSGCFTAPITEMGRLLYSALLTVTKGSPMSPSASSADAIAVQFGRHQPLGLDAPLEHGEPNQSIRADPHRARQFWHVVDRNGHQVAGADSLGG